MKCKIYVLDKTEGGRSSALQETSKSQELVNIHIGESEFTYGCKLVFLGDIQPGEESKIDIEHLEGYHPFTLNKGDVFTLIQEDFMIATGYAVG